MAKLDTGSSGGGSAEPRDSSPTNESGPLEQAGEAASAVVDTLFSRAASAADQLKNFQNDPARYIFARITEYILTFVFALVFGVVELIDTFFDRIGSILGFSARQAFVPLGTAGDVILSSIRGVNEWVASTLIGAGLPDSVGIFIVVGLYLFEVALVVRAIPPALLAASDLLGAIPVIGSVLDAVLTFVLEYVEITTLWGGDS